MKAQKAITPLKGRINPYALSYEQRYNTEWSGSTGFSYLTRQELINLSKRFDLLTNNNLQNHIDFIDASCCPEIVNPYMARTSLFNNFISTPQGGFTNSDWTYNSGWACNGAGFILWNYAPKIDGIFFQSNNAGAVGSISGLDTNQFNCPFGAYDTQSPVGQVYLFNFNGSLYSACNTSDILNSGVSVSYNTFSVSYDGTSVTTKIGSNTITNIKSFDNTCNVDICFGNRSGAFTVQSGNLQFLAFGDNSIDKDLIYNLLTTPL